MEKKDKLRIDKYLWSIRLFKTRRIASDACEKGRVKMEGTSLKASKTVNIGEVYDVRTDVRKWVVKVTGLLDHRLQYSEAVNYYEDITPPEALDKPESQAATFHTGKRLSKIGRPTKRERRDLDDYMENDKPKTNED